MAKKVLIVDDSESIREVVAFTLETAGHEVTRAKDGISALDLLNNGTFDLIITDLHMPNMDGVELIRQIRQLAYYKYTPILFLTTESNVSRKQEAKDAGATGWIVKPFMPEKLLAAVTKVCP